jgi:hypothetical protein
MSSIAAVYSAVRGCWPRDLVVRAVGAKTKKAATNLLGTPPQRGSVEENRDSFSLQ